MNFNKRKFFGFSLKRIATIMILTTLTIGIISVILLEEMALPYMPIVPWKRSGEETPASYGLQYDSLEVAVERSFKSTQKEILRGYFIHSVLPKPRGTIILLHGIGGHKESNLGFSRILADNGFHVILYDQRAHGKSDGKYCTFGFYEKKDVSKFVDIAVAKFPSLPIGIHGASMGGAVAIQALEHDKRLKFGIIESTFNTLENVVIEYGRGYFKFRSRWLAQRVLSKSADIAEFKPFDIKPIESCKNIGQPILMVHGDMDEKIPIDFNQQNFAALQSKDKEFYVVKGAGHQNVGEIGGEQYLTKLLAFLNRQVAVGTHAEHQKS